MAKWERAVRKTDVSRTAHFFPHIPAFPFFSPSSAVGKPVSEINVNMLVFCDELSYDKHNHCIG